jgi:methionine-gamma-lyase
VTPRNLRGKKLDTLAVHGGGNIDPTTGAITPSIETSVAFAAEYGTIGFSASDTDEALVPFAYAREGHPKREGARGAPRAARRRRGGRDLFTRGFLRAKGIEVSIADMSDLEDVQAALRPNTKLIHAETPCNPVLKLVDLRGLCELAHDAGARVVVDGTFATPAVTRPLEHGVDFVAYSLTKYMGGHGDALGGAIVGPADQMHALRSHIGVHLGATLAPFNSWLIMRGLETLGIRMRAYSAAALAIAKLLEAHPKVTRVRYPGSSRIRSMNSPSGRWISSRAWSRSTSRTRSASVPGSRST